MKMMEVDPKKRITSEELPLHEFFNGEFREENSTVDVE
jgi:serine/threonine protein kinase